VLSAPAFSLRRQGERGISPEIVYSRFAEAPVEVGSLIEFLYVDAGNSNPFRRARPASFKQGRVDTYKYESLVRDAGRDGSIRVQLITFLYLSTP